MSKQTENAAPAPRVFNYNGMELGDPDPSMTVDQVKGIWAVTYPELSTAAVSGPEVVGGRQVYKFSRAVGTKG